MTMRTTGITYVGFGSGIYVIPPDGLPIKVPGTKTKDSVDTVANRYIKGKGKYQAGTNDIIMHINKQKSMIFLVFGKRFNSSQQETIKTLMEDLGKDLTAQILSCQSDTVHYEADKFIQRYNLIVQA